MKNKSHFTIFGYNYQNVKTNERVRLAFMVLGIVFTLITAVLHFFVPAAVGWHPIFVALSIICWLENLGTHMVRQDFKELCIDVVIIFVIIFILT